MTGDLLRLIQAPVRVKTATWHASAASSAARPAEQPTPESGAEARVRGQWLKEIRPKAEQNSIRRRIIFCQNLAPKMTIYNRGIIYARPDPYALRITHYAPRLPLSAIIR